MRNDQKALADIYSKIITESSGRKVIKGDVDLENLFLTVLPEWLSDVEVEGIFYCSNNKLTTLQGAPETVEDDFFCRKNNLTTLQGAPKTVGGDFYCDSNKLTTLAGAPETVEGSFSCVDNKLTTLAGAPKTVGVAFYCYDNTNNFTVEDVRAVSNVGGSISVLEEED